MFWLRHSSSKIITDHVYYRLRIESLSLSPPNITSEGEHGSLVRSVVELFGVALIPGDREA